MSCEEHVEKRARAREMRLAGASRAQIARALQMKPTSKSLRSWLKGVPAAEWTRRPNAKDAWHERAVQLRQQGMSYREISREVPVSKASLSLWLRHVPLSTEQKDRITRLSDWGRQKGADKKKAARIETQRRIAGEATQEIGSLSARELLIAGAILYWAEGSKDKPWRKSEDVIFINSDPGLVRLFVAWVGMLGIPKERLAFRVSIHETADVGRATTYWADLVGVAPDRFANPSIKRHKPRTNRRNVGDTYRGCLIIRVRRGTELYRRIAGWIEGVVQALGESTQATLWPVV